ncbi:MAG: nuclear transport factor 2 family protein [Acidimicrobiales bacterium]
MDPANVARSYLDAFATGDADAVAAHVTDDFVNEHTAALSSSCTGKTEYRRRLPDFLASFAGVRYEIDDVLTEGDKVAAAYTMRATYEGHEIAVRGVMRMRIHDGLVAHRVDYYDALGFLQQIGKGDIS